MFIANSRNAYALRASLSLLSMPLFRPSVLSISHRECHTSRHASHAMTQVAILPETSAQGEVEYRAIASGHQALAKTAGRLWTR